MAILVSWSIIDYLLASSISIKIKSTLQKSSIIDLWNYIDCNSNCIFQCGKPMQKYVTQTFRIWTWLFYFLLGAEMKTLKVWISNHISVVFHLLLCMEITILIIVFENYVGCKRILEMSGTLHAEYFMTASMRCFG